MKARGGLHIVDAPRSAEDELRDLFGEEVRLTRQLVGVRAALQSARERYREDNGLMMLPRCELLRERYGPKPEPRA